MTFGLPVSLLLHGALLAWAILIATTAPLPRLPDEIPIEVAMISVKDFETQQKKGDVNAKQLDSAPQPKPAEIVSTQEAPKPKPPAPAPPPPAAAEPPPPADPIADKIAALPEPKAEPPKPEPKKAEPPPPEKDPIAEALALEQAKVKAAADAKAAAEAKALKDAEDKRRKEAADKKKRDDAEKRRLADLKKKQDEAKRFDPSKIAAAIGNSDDPPPKELDKDPTKKPGAAPAPADAFSPSKNKGPSAGTAAGKGDRLTAREEDMIGSILNRSLAPCWRHLPGGNPSDPSPDVKLSWNMNADGSLVGEPKVLTPINSPALQDAADRAVRAVIACAPYKLPPDLYQHWRSVARVFEPPK